MKKTEDQERQGHGMGHVADERDIFTLELYFLKELKRIALQLPPLLNGTSKIHDFYTNIK